MDSTPALPRPTPAMLGDRLTTLAASGEALEVELGRLWPICRDTHRDGTPAHVARLRERTNGVQKQAGLLAECADNFRSISHNVGASIPRSVSPDGQWWESSLNLAVDELGSRARVIGAMLAQVDVEDESGVDHLQRFSVSGGEPIMPLVRNLAARANELRAIAPTAVPTQQIPPFAFRDEHLTILAELASANQLVKASELDGKSGMPPYDRLVNLLREMESATPALVERPSGVRTGYQVTEAARKELIRREIIDAPT